MELLPTPEDKYLKEIRYDAKTLELRVLFKAGKMYEYVGFEETDWERFKNAPVKNTFFYRNIQNLAQLK